MQKLSLAILMATYNGEEFIREQINSILNQTYKNWKLIIHDDGSTDNTVDIIKEYTKKYPNKIILIEDNIKCNGAKENFSHLIKSVHKNFNFDYILFSDQDDIWLPNKIEVSLSKIQEMENKFGKNIPLLVHTDLKVVDEYLNIMSNSFWRFQRLNPKKNSFNYIMVQNNVTGCTTMINKALFKKFKSIPANAIMHDWWIALIASAFGKIIPIYEPTVLYRQHKDNDTGAKKFDIKYIFSKFKNKDSIMDSISKTFLQAEAFKDIFFKELNNEQKLILDDYLSLKRKSFLDKLVIVNKNRFFKQGILRNLGFFYCLLKVYDF